MRSSLSRSPNESSDAVGLIVALLVRFPEIATLVSHPSDGTLTISFVIGKRLERSVQREVKEQLLEHLRSFTELSAEPLQRLEVACETDDRISFVRVTRDARTLSREELQLLCSLIAERFGELLVRSPVAEDELIDQDPQADDDIVEYALDALRDPGQQKSLVGVREDKRVMVYFTSARKKAKRRARS